MYTRSDRISIFRGVEPSPRSLYYQKLSWNTSHICSEMKAKVNENIYLHLSIFRLGQETFITPHILKRWKVILAAISPANLEVMHRVGDVKYSLTRTFFNQINTAGLIHYIGDLHGLRFMVQGHIIIHESHMQIRFSWSNCFSVAPFHKIIGHFLTLRLTFPLSLVDSLTVDNEWGGHAGPLGRYVFGSTGVVAHVPELRLTDEQVSCIGHYVIPILCINFNIVLQPKHLKI